MDDDTRERLSEELRSAASALMRLGIERGSGSRDESALRSTVIDVHERIVSVAFELDPRDERQRAGLR